tara:strand:+ start:82 stop:360 length:279 start_codon:yes stop_codon:yes gene_type:complete
MKNDKTLETVANEYVEISAQIKALTEKKNQCRAVLEAADCGSISTPTHTLTLTPVESKRLDMKAVRAKLTRQFIQAHTLITDSLRITVKEIK